LRYSLTLNEKSQPKSRGRGWTVIAAFQEVDVPIGRAVYK